MYTIQEIPLVDRLAAANLVGRRAGWTFSTFPRGPAQAAAPLVAAAHAYARSAEPRPAGLVLVGPTGVGKTGLAVSIARARTEAGDGGYWPWSLAVGSRAAVAQGVMDRAAPGPVWFEPWAVLKMRLREEESCWGGEAQALAELRRVDLFVLDDIGLGAYTEWREEVLWVLLSRVEAGRRLVVTANLPPLALRGVIGERNADRLSDAEMFRVVTVRQGRSLRQRARKLSR